MRNRHLIITTTTKAAFVLLLFAGTITGCQKKGARLSDPPLQVEEITSTNDPSQPVITIPANTNLAPSRSLLNFEFDWEHTQNMPVAPGSAAVAVPWSDQAVKNYDPGLQYDYKKSDGWELVYNNFSDSADYANRIFILYNKFRGLLRYYCYNPIASNPNVDSYRSLINEIALTGSPYSSPLFNYAGQFIVDINSNARKASIIEPWPIRERGWYISQFEMAYDRNIAGYNWQQFGLSWTLAFARVEELSLNNTPAKNKMIYLEKPGLSFSDNAARGIAIGSNMQVHVKAATGFNELSGIFSGAVIDKLKQTVTDSTAGNMLHATLVPALGITDCKLDVMALIRTDYNLVGFVAGLSLTTPGIDNSKVIGFGPLFNEPMGVFYLASKPVVHHAAVTGLLPEQYTLDVSSVEYVINPFILKYADVRHFRQEIIAIEATETPNLTEAKLFRGKILKASAPLNVLGVRVSFEVVPKNGSAPVKLIKTFKADLQNS